MPAVPNSIAKDLLKLLGRAVQPPRLPWDTTKAVASTILHPVSTFRGVNPTVNRFREMYPRWSKVAPVWAGMEGLGLAARGTGLGIAYNNLRNAKDDPKMGDQVMSYIKDHGLDYGVLPLVHRYDVPNDILSAANVAGLHEIYVNRNRPGLIAHELGHLQDYGQSMRENNMDPVKHVQQIVHDKMTPFATLRREYAASRNGANLLSKATGMPYDQATKMTHVGIPSYWGAEIGRLVSPISWALTAAGMGMQDRFAKNVGTPYYADFTTAAIRKDRPAYEKALEAAKREFEEMRKHYGM